MMNHECLLPAAATSTIIDLVKTAKLIREALREAYPGIKFSVRCSRYSMGQSMISHGPMARRKPSSSPC